MLENLFCNHSLTLLDALEIINQNTKGAVFIIDENKRLCGVLTDGDIRRLLLGGCGLQEKIKDILTKKVVFARQDESREEMWSKLNEAIKILPIVDDHLHVVDYLEYKANIHFPIVSPDLKGNELKYLTDAFLSTWISSKGEYIEKFEKEFSSFCECKYGVATSNGTTALHLALTACGVGPGDEVIVPDLTFAATINVVFHAGATPVIVDVDKDSWCINPAEIEKAITPKTKAVIPVHLYGQPCDMNRIMQIAKRNHLFVIEDCAEAHGAEYAGKKVGSFGDAGCFSFFGNKIITTGEGGMCVANSEKLDRRMRLLRDHGMSRERKYWHEAIGYNYRMTNLQAAIGVAQLERINEILSDRRSNENKYREELSHIPCLEFQRDNLPNRKKITWLVSALVKNGKRDQYIKEFGKKGIDARSFFCSLSTMDIYKDFLFSNTESKKISQEGINFPTGTDHSHEIMDKIKSIFEANT